MHGHEMIDGSWALHPEHELQQHSGLLHARGIDIIVQVSQGQAGVQIRQTNAAAYAILNRIADHMHWQESPRSHHDVSMHAACHSGIAACAPAL